MSTLGDNWSAGPKAALPAPPPRPDGVVALRPLAVAVPGPETFSSVPSWKRFGAIMGVVGGFFFLLTIPGWIALSHYRKWKRNEIPTPNGLIVWGYIWLAIVVLVLVGAAASPS